MGWVMHDVLSSPCQEGLTCNLEVGIALLRYTLKTQNPKAVSSLTTITKYVIPYTTSWLA